VLGAPNDLPSLRVIFLRMARWDASGAGRSSGRRRWLPGRTSGWSRHRPRL